jgi:hypothetical protein
MVASAPTQVLAVMCRIKKVVLMRWLVLAVALCIGHLAHADARLLIVSGIGGEDRFSQQFRDWALQMRDAATGPLGMDPADVVWLCESPELDPTQCAGESRRELILETITRLLAAQAKVRPLMVLMLGHGTTRDNRALFNVAGPDLSAEDLNEVFGAAHASSTEQQIAVVNTTPSSALFARLLSRNGRIVITATARSQESDHTRFAAHFIAAYAAGEADADRDERVSLLEAFQFAVREVTREYKDKRQVSTEHAMLEDNGDGEGARKPQADGGATGDARGVRTATRRVDGALAAQFFLASAVRREDMTAERLKLENEARNLVTRISALRRRKAAMRPVEYLQKLETLLVELALNRRQVREGGS